MSNETVRRLTKSSAIATGATGISFVCSMAALALNARALGASDFGLLAVVQAYFAFISGLATFDNWQPVVRLGVRSPARIGLILGSTVSLDLIASAAAAAVAVTGLLTFGGPLGIERDHSLPLYFFCISLLAGVGGTPKGYFRLKGRFDILAMNQLSFALLLLCSSFALWYWGASLDIYLVAFAILTAIPGVSIFIRMLLSLHAEGIAVLNPFISASRRRYFKRVLHLSSGNSILSTLLTSRHQVALFIVSSMVGTSAAGLFAVAIRCANAFTRIAAPINQVLFPELLKMVSERDPILVRRSMRKAALGFLVFCIALSALAFFASEQIVVLVAGAEFSAADDIFAVLLVAEIALWFGYYFNPIILHTAGQSPMVKSNAAVMVFTCAASLVLAKVAGALGVGFALLAGSILTCAGLYLLAEQGVGKAVAKQTLDATHV